MTRVAIPAPPIPADITAEQVVAYMARPGSGWVEAGPTGHPWRSFGSRGSTIYLLSERAPHVPAEHLEEVIERIARAEGRYPSAVLADIEGPSRGVAVGVGCGPSEPTFEQTEARFACRVKMGLVPWRVRT